MKALQLKITIADSRPPIWRRVLVSPRTTFWESVFDPSKIQFTDAKERLKWAKSAGMFK